MIGFLLSKGKILYKRKNVPSFALQLFWVISSA